MSPCAVLSPSLMSLIAQFLFMFLQIADQTMTEVNAVPIYNLLLDTSESPEERVEVVNQGQGEPFELRCSLKGEAAPGETLSLFLQKEGNRNITERTTSAHRELGIKVDAFDEKQHAGIYECRVKRVDGAMHMRQMAIRKRLEPMVLPQFYKLCDGPDSKICHHGGTCMRRLEAGQPKEIICGCREGYIGPSCESIQTVITQTVCEDLQRTTAGLAATSVIAVVFLIGAVILAFLHYRQRKRLRHLSHMRQNNHEQLENVPVIPPHSSYDDNYLESEMHLANTTAITYMDETISASTVERVPLQQQPMRGRLRGTSDSRIFDSVEHPDGDHVK